MALELGSSKSNVLAIKKETVEGTIAKPTSGSDFVTLQPDASLTPSFEVLNNEEIRASLGAAKPVQGLEQPEASFSHYMKASGVEGQPPEIADILESLFGLTSTNATERTLTASSTVSVLKLAAGGSDFARGKAVMIKDATNGFRIRPVESVATDDLTLGFQVPTGMAPLTGTALGKCVNYSPANSGHPSLSMWMYRGNGQAIEAIAGAKCVSMNISSQSGQFINGSFSFQGTKYFFNPIEITSTNKFLDITDDGGEESVSIPEKTYRDPDELAQALQDALNAIGNGDAYTVVYNSKGTSKGKFTLTSNGSVFTILWNTGDNAANSIGTTLGFSVAADDTGGLTYTSDNVQAYAAPYTPEYDTTDPVVAKGQEVLLGNTEDFECFESANVSIDMGVPNDNVPSICAESGIAKNIATGRQVSITIQALLDKGAANNFRRFRANEAVKFCYNWGVKSGGNWVPGKCMNFFVPTAVVSSFGISELNSVIVLDITLTAFVDANGNGEVYLNQL